MAVKFEARLPTKTPASAAVYEIPAPRVGVTALRETAESLGLRGTGGDVTTSPRLMVYSEGRRRLEIARPSGAVAFFLEEKYGHEPEKPFELSDRKADAIARKFVERSKLVPPKAMRLARVTHMHSAVGDVRTGKVEERITDAGVVYRRAIGDVLVDGPGGFGMVTIDPEGEVVAFRSVWRQVGERVASVRIKKPEEAVRALEEHVAKVRGDVLVTKAAFGYFELAAFDRQRFMEPAYSFVYVVRNEHVALKSAFVVHAGNKTFGVLSGKKRFSPGKQPERRQ